MVGLPKESPAGHIPSYVIWAITVTIPTLVAAVNYIMVISDMSLLDFKFGFVQSMMNDHGIYVGSLVLLGVCLTFAAIPACMVCFIAPGCAGSGIPEVLSFLNANYMPGLFTIRSFVVRVVGIVLVQASGFPVGREGPMVGIGGCIGFGVAYALLRPCERKTEKDQPTGDVEAETLGRSPQAMIINEERFAHARRIGCALGGAAGIATAFNAPIGGIIYMFEEMSVASLTPDFSRFMCTVTSTFMARMLLNVTGMDTHRLVIYEEIANNSHGHWDWVDLPGMFCLAAFTGACGAAFSFSLLRVWRLRQRFTKALHRFQPAARIIECLLYCALCTCAWSCLPLLFPCVKDSDDTHRRLSADGKSDVVRYTCAEDEHNELASLLLTGAEGAVKQLYSRGSSTQSLGPMAVMLFAYGILATGMAGLCVPMGTFIPSMLIGGLIGRIVGEAGAAVSTSAFAHPGVYAVVGSAGMLAGITHMTIAIVTLLVEATSDPSLIMPLMLATFVAHATSKRISPHGYDEQLIICKGVPFLEPEMPDHMLSAGLKAIDVCEVQPEEVKLRPNSSMKAIKRALKHERANYFPVITDAGFCVGITTRRRLTALVQVVQENPFNNARLKARRPSNGSEASYGSRASNTSVVSASSEPSDSLDFSSLHPVASDPSRMGRRHTGYLTDPETENKVKDLIKQIYGGPIRPKGEDGNDSYGPDVVALLHVMDAAPYTILESMPLPRFYSLFCRAGVNVACVVSNEGRFRGIMSRRMLIDTTSKFHGKSAHIGGNNYVVQPLSVGMQIESEGSDMSPTSPQFRNIPSRASETPKSDYFEAISESDCSTGDEASISGSISPCLRRPSIRSSSSGRTDEDGGMQSPIVGSVRPSVRSSFSSRSLITHDRATGKRRSSSLNAGALPVVVDTMNPNELRAQLASAVARLAAAEQKQESLRVRLASTESQRDALLAQVKGQEEVTADEAIDAPTTASRFRASSGSETPKSNGSLSSKLHAKQDPRGFIASSDEDHPSPREYRTRTLSDEGMSKSFSASKLLTPPASDAAGHRRRASSPSRSQHQTLGNILEKPKKSSDGAVARKTLQECMDEASNQSASSKPSGSPRHPRERSALGNEPETQAPCILLGPLGLPIGSALQERPR